MGSGDVLAVSGFNSETPLASKISGLMPAVRRVSMSQKNSGDRAQHSACGAVSSARNRLMARERSTRIPLMNATCLAFAIPDGVCSTRRKPTGISPALAGWAKNGVRMNICLTGFSPLLQC